MRPDAPSVERRSAWRDWRRHCACGVRNGGAPAFPQSLTVPLAAATLPACRAPAVGVGLHFGPERRGADRGRDRRGVAGLIGFWKQARGRLRR